MKLKTITTTTTLLFGAAMLSYGQTETDKSRSSGQGGLNTKPTQNQSAEANERAQQEAQAGAERAAQDREMNPAADTDTATTPGAPATGLTTPSTANPAGAERNLAMERDMNEPDWRGSQQDDMKLTDVAAEIQKGLRDASSGGQLDGEVTRIKYADKELYRGKAEIDGSEDLHVYVDTSGKLIKTQQELDLESAPEAVRAAAERESEGSADLDRVLQEMADGKVSYIIQLDADNDRKRWIQMDEAGKVMKTHEQQED